MKGFVIVILGFALSGVVLSADPVLSNERVVFETKFGQIEFAFMPQVAPVTAPHIFKLCVLGGYTTNHFFRVDRGFVAQTADVTSGRQVKMSSELREEAEKKVPLEVKEGVKHTEGVLSMGRYDDPNSGTSSFSILLGAAPHLDMKYTIFAKVTRGIENLHKMESVETRREGIFVMPKERITIESTYWYVLQTPQKYPALTVGQVANEADLRDEFNTLKLRFAAQAEELQRVRKKCLPA